jgi:hypothetical protein
MGTGGSCSKSRRNGKDFLFLHSNINMKDEIEKIDPAIIKGLFEHGV